MAQDDELKRYGLNSGMDQDSSPEDVDKNGDYISATNLRNIGSKAQQLGYNTNIANTDALAGSLLPGINDIIGGGRFDDTGQILVFRYNTAGNNQILLYNISTGTYTVIYTDITNSGSIPLLPLNPQNEVLAILVNKTYVIFWAKDLEVGYFNLNTLASGGYGTVLWEDLSLLKPQCPVPISHPANATTPDIITSGFGSDAGQPANYLYGKLPQFIVQGINADFNYTAWSTRSRRFTPYQENTPTLGAAVSQNNYIVVAVNIWSTRLITINIACQFDDSDQFYIIKSVDTAHIYALTSTSVDVSTEIYEAYDPSTKTYYFVFYNNTVTLPVDPNETDLLFDPIYPSNAGVLLNGNIPALGDWKTLYARPSIPVTVKAVGYNPNITIPVNTYSNPLVSLGSFPGASGSGAGNHRRNIWVAIAGSPNTGDTIVIITADIRNASATFNQSYTVPSAQAGNLLAVVTSIAANLGGSFVAYLSGYMINWTGQPYYGLQTYSIELFFGGASVANSIPTVLDNTSQQIAKAFFDNKERPFPVDTDSTCIVTMPSYAQQNGNATEINVTLNTTTAPVGAVYAQLMITKPRVLKVLDVISTLITYKGAWDAKNNVVTPGGGSLAINTGNIGDTYQITTPSGPLAGASYHNLGHNDTYNTGDYITNVGGTSGGSQAGQYYAVLPNSFGNLATNQGGILVFSLNSLSLLNAEYSQENVTTNLVYDFAQGDRCTLHYWIGSIGAIATGNITPGTGYTNGTSTNVALTGGTGTGAIATVTVAGGIVTNVVFTSPGSGYTIGDVLTGTVTGGTGWSIAVQTLVTNGINYFNSPCIDLAVLGYDAGTYLVKVENSAALTFAGGHILYNGFQIDARNVFIRLYSPAPQTTAASASINETEWFEIGLPIPIVNGQFPTTSFSITDGGAYYKTRTFPDAIQPYTNPPIQVLATDLNYSDFYPSAYYSFGRVRTFYDILEQSEQSALIITGEPYITGSKINGLNRFFPAHIYGNSNGQTSSSQGGIQIMEQVGQELVVFQERGVFYIPVNEAYTVLNAELTGTSISSILLNNGRYDTENVGIGLTKCFARRYSTLYFVDPNKSLPYRITGNKIESIARKMSKFFKNLLQSSYAAGNKVQMFYDDYYEEVPLTVLPPSSQLLSFPFNSANWNAFNNYNITPGDVVSVTAPAHASVSYNSGTGIATYTPTPGYIGNDTGPFVFNPGSGNISLNNCLTWIAGNTTVNTFSFTPMTGVPLSTLIQSNQVTNNGPNIAVPISITGGQYSINGGAFTSAAGTVNPNDTVVVEVMSSASYTTAASTTLTMGSTSATFTATTRANANFGAQAQYNINITGIIGTGVPAGFNPTINITSGNTLYLAYTTLAVGNLGITISGTPVLPSKIVLYIAGVDSGHIDIVSGIFNYIINNAVSQNDPTVILIAINLQ